MRVDSSLKEKKDRHVQLNDSDVRSEVRKEKKRKSYGSNKGLHINHVGWWNKDDRIFGDVGSG